MTAESLGYMLNVIKTAINAFPRLTIDQPTNQYGANTSNASSGNTAEVKRDLLLHTADDKWLHWFDLPFRHSLGNFCHDLPTPLSDEFPFLSQ